MAAETPFQDYYPSWKLRLILRFDEFGDDSRLKPAPKKIVKNMAGIKDPRADLVAQKDPKNPGAYVLLPKGQSATPPTQPANEQTSSADGQTWDVTLIPSEFNLEQNGVRTADTFTATFRFVDVPIDPRLVRACGVEFYLGCLSADDYAAGIAGENRSLSGGGQESMNLVPDEWTDARGKTRTNRRFVGWVDKWTVEWSEEGEATVRVECRDNTQLLIDQEVPPKLVVDGAKPLDEAVAQYLANFPQFKGMSVEYRPGGTTDIPMLGAVLAKTAFKPQLGPPPAGGGGGSTKLSVWDYLTDVCRSVGHNIYFEDSTVVIVRLKSLTSNQAVRRADDAFQGRDLPGGTHLDYRRFIYGRNVLSMRLSRNFSKKAPQNIEVRAYPTGAKTMLVERFPLKEDRQKYVLPGDSGTDQKWMVINVTGVNDPKTLRAVAQSYYESVGRNELEVEVQTKNLGSYGGGDLDPDILDMRPGDTFEVLSRRESDGEEGSTLTAIETALAEQRDASPILRRRGFSPEFVKAYTEAYTNAGFLPTFKLSQLRINGQVDSGVQLTLNGRNYIEVRADKLLPAGEEPQPLGVGTSSTARGSVVSP